MGSPLFTLPGLSVTDVFFYHERATPMGMYVATTYGAALIAPLAGGYIYSSMGWRAPPYFVGGYCFVTFIFLFLFLEESTFRRQDAVAVVSTAEVIAEADDVKDKEAGMAQVVAVDARPDEAEGGMVHSADRLVSPWRGPKPFKLFTISPHAKSLLLRGCLYPLMMLRLPGWSSSVVT